MTPVAPTSAGTASPLDRRAPIVWLALSLGVTLVAFVIAAARGWPGTPIDCREVTCYCEAPHAGWLRQPANTISNLVPIALAVVAALRRPRATTPAGAAFERALPVALGVQGMGSAFYHSSLVEWAGNLDSISMLVVMALFVSTNRLRHRGTFATERAGVTLVVVWLAIAALGVVLALVRSEAVSPVMFALLITNLGLEVGVTRRFGPPADERCLRFGLLIFLASIGVWSFSAAPGQLLCAPRSLAQGHALWHAGAGVAVFCFGRHVSRALAPRARGFAGPP